MSADMIFLKATIDAWAINAKREKEAGVYRPEGSTQAVATDQFHEWSGQEIAFKRVQDLLEKAGVK